MEPPKPHQELCTGGHLEIAVPEPQSLNFQNYFGGLTSRIPLKNSLGTTKIQGTP